VRHNRDGEPALPFYGYITALAEDPIEKKPLYHFRPGTAILSAGFAGCNLHCPFCQNWQISQKTDTPGRFCPPEELIGMALKTGRQAAIAYTYSEPLVHVEFLFDCMEEARKAGVVNVLVSDGCVNPEAAEAILDLTDAANIDLKCFSGETYSKVLGGDLAATTSFIRRAVEKGVHLEITTLVVPGLNDSEEELDKCASFIAELEKAGPSVPWHLSAYHSDWKWQAPPTDPLSLVSAAARARKTVHFVYTGNIALQGETNFCDTLCPCCGKILVSRRGYRVNTSGINLQTIEGKTFYSCSSCGETTPLRW
jgi:pyruvate formate lyase activating enzyme